jgi:NAD-dependent deacetylase
VNDPIETLAARLRTARRVSVLTGAGVSAASGVPTFRGADGLWRRHRPEDLATPQAFARDPVLVWTWYAERRAAIARCRPNPAHAVLAAWSQPPRRWTVVTQNVDDLHADAGTERLVRLHGSLWELACARPCPAGEEPWPDRRVPISPMPPACPHCGGAARPAVVWFGEALDPGALAAADAAASCDVFIAAGTSAVVYPAAGFLHEAARRGALTVEINPEATPATAAVDMAIAGGAEDVLPALDARLRADTAPR